MPMSGTSLQVGVEGNGLVLHGDVRHKGKLGFWRLCRFKLMWVLLIQAQHNKKFKTN